MKGEAQVDKCFRVRMGRSVLFLAFAVCAALVSYAALSPALATDQAVQQRATFLPAVQRTSAPLDCRVSEAPYQAIPVHNWQPADRAAAEHPDLNLALRGFEATNAHLGLVDYAGTADPGAPQLPGLFSNRRTGQFRAVYRVYQWDWASGRRAGLIASPEVTLAGLAVTAGERIHLPDRAGGEIYGGGFKGMVLYADERQITIKYTRDDTVVGGYAIHLFDVCVDPQLLALYRQMNAAGRGSLPGLTGGQALGVAPGVELRVAIRDEGSFMDPRSRKDWWQGR
jgi:hypothetical protein